MITFFKSKIKHLIAEEAHQIYEERALTKVQDQIEETVVDMPQLGNNAATNRIKTGLYLVPGSNNGRINRPWSSRRRYAGVTWTMLEIRYINERCLGVNGIVSSLLVLRTFAGLSTTKRERNQ